MQNVCDPLTSNIYAPKLQRVTSNVYFLLEFENQLRTLHIK